VKKTKSSPRRNPVARIVRRLRMQVIPNGKKDANTKRLRPHEIKREAEQCQFDHVGIVQHLFLKFPVDTL
jgi:hypothetical protein